MEAKQNQMIGRWAATDIHISVHGLIDRRATAGDVASASDRGGIREPRRSINLGGETPQRAGERPQRWAATEGKSCMRSYSSRERAGAAPDCQLLSQSASATPKIVFGGFAWWQAEN
jgi:hypothetical protein